MLRLGLSVGVLLTARNSSVSKYGVLRLGADAESGRCDSFTLPVVNWDQRLKYVGCCMGIVWSVANT